MKIDRSGFPFIAGALVPAGLLFAARRRRLAAPLLLLGACFAFFFRDPDRRIPSGPGLVVAPADGRVVLAGEGGAGAPPGRWRQISIFLSPLDVHVNRAPVAGRVTRVDYRPGRFLPAYRAEASTRNERNDVWLDADGQTVVCRQVVGVLARRIVCRVTPGDLLRTGDRFGIMKFGSRIDLFLPATAALRVEAGERVRAGESVVAALDGATTAASGSD